MKKIEDTFEYQLQQFQDAWLHFVWLFAEHTGIIWLMGKLHIETKRRNYMAEIANKIFTRTELSLLIYLETRSVDYGGLVDISHMNSVDMDIAKKME